MSVSQWVSILELNKGYNKYIFYKFEMNSVP